MEQKELNNLDFTKSPKDVANNLLGKFICRKFDDGTVLRWCITETEAYDNNEKVTYKNEMFCGIGEWCLYYDMLMVNCGKGYDNVLIRALDCVKGPCNIVKALEIKEIKNEVTKKDVLCKNKLWLEDWGVTVKKYAPKKRVGIVKKAENEEGEAKKNYQAEALYFPFF